MKIKSVRALLVLWLFTAGLCFASPQMGTWKLNEGKSKLGPNATKNNTVKYEASGDDIKVTVDGVDPKGAAVHSEWTGKFDGKDYPVTGDPNYDTRSYKPSGANTLMMTLKKAGKVMGTGKIEVSADGKTRTVKVNATTAEGKKVSTTAVYDKE